MPVEPTRNPEPLALIGDPVAHSLSPLIHNAALRALGLPPAYIACRVNPADLPGAVAGLVALGFRGANVTIPHKEAVFRLVDRCTPEAEAVGAVNTLRIERMGGTVTVVGDNTDVAGFCAPLEPLTDLITGRDVLVFGTGGAARAAAYGISRRFSPARVRVVARRIDRAEALAAEFGLAAALPWPAARSEILGADVLVNATPLGMAPAVDGTPVPDASSFRAGHLVYDLVYLPSRTRFLLDAESAGAVCLGGLPMLIGQAAAAFRGWMGVEMPIEAVERAISEALSVL